MSSSDTEDRRSHRLLLRPGDSDEFPAWSMVVQTKLEAKSVTHLLLVTPDAYIAENKITAPKAVKEVRTADAEARAIILAHLHKSMVPTVAEPVVVLAEDGKRSLASPSASVLWTRLQTLFSHVERSVVVHKRKELLNFTVRPDDVSFSAFLHRFNTALTAVRTASLGVDVPSELDLIIILTSACPDCLASAIPRAEAATTLVGAVAELRALASKPSFTWSSGVPATTSPLSSSAAAAVPPPSLVAATYHGHVVRNPSVVCRNCGEIGHPASICIKARRRGNRERNARDRHRGRARDDDSDSRYDKRTRSPRTSTRHRRRSSPFRRGGDQAQSSTARGGHNRRRDRSPASDYDDDEMSYVSFCRPVAATAASPFASLQRHGQGWMLADTCSALHLFPDEPQNSRSYPREHTMHGVGGPMRTTRACDLNVRLQNAKFRLKDVAIAPEAPPIISIPKMDAGGFSTITHRGRIYAFKASAIDDRHPDFRRAIMVGKLINGVFAFPFSAAGSRD
jgi:hypothetical protein